MNNKWKWVLGITRAMIVLLLPLLVWALFLPDGGYGMMSLFPAWLIMIALVALVVFGISEEG